MKSSSLTSKAGRAGQSEEVLFPSATPLSKKQKLLPEATSADCFKQEES